MENLKQLKDAYAATCRNISYTRLAIQNISGQIKNVQRTNKAYPTPASKRILSQLKRERNELEYKLNELLESKRKIEKFVESLCGGN